ncbi:MAG: hypothetical protein ACQES1_11515 [Bacteroidota bacterium]
MIRKLNFKSPVLNLLIVFLVLTASSELVAQKKSSSDLKNFKLIVEKTENGIKMQSLEGSAWINLSFSLNDDQAQAIDEYGMTDMDDPVANKEANLADYLFTISKTDEGIKLKGIHGTAWTDLSFSLAANERKVIDQNGMTIPY